MHGQGPTIVVFGDSQLAYKLRHKSAQSTQGTTGELLHFRKQIPKIIMFLSCSMLCVALLAPSTVAYPEYWISNDQTRCGKTVAQALVAGLGGGGMSGSGYQLLSAAQPCAWNPSTSQYSLSAVVDASLPTGYAGWFATVPGGTKITHQ